MRKIFQLITWVIAFYLANFIVIMGVLMAFTLWKEWPLQKSLEIYEEIFPKLH